MKELEHRCRLSLISQAETWRLGDDALLIDTEKTSTEIPYGDIASLQLITFAGVGGRQGRLTLVGGSAGKFKTGSHHYVGLSNFENRAASYRPFIRDLAARVAKANPDAEFQAGSNTLMIAWVIVCCLLLGLVLLAILGAMENTTPAAPLIAAVLFVFAAGPFAIRWMKRSKPAGFDPNDIPDRLLV